jgi:ADP-ribose pyrophosphatase YjhB (NUDIX family)
MHELQKHILSVLITQHHPRYADLKPTDIEGNQFMYHLRKLMAEKWICKRQDGRYELTPAGQLHIEQLSLATLMPRIQPKIVTLVLCRDEQGRALVYRRKREPFYGYVGLPYGKIHLGETIDVAARRELQEKTGMQANLTHRGEAYIKTTVGGELVSHILAHTFVAEHPTGTLRPNSSIGMCFWASIDELYQATFIPGFLNIYKKLSESPTERFFYEWNFNLPSTN